MQHLPRNTLISPDLDQALRQRLATGEQSLILLNRRGYAPALHCPSCNWKSDCPHCSAFRVFHKMDRTLRCHHCGLSHPVPRACPACGNLDIAPLGRGTEKIEEWLTQHFAGMTRVDGGPVRIARIDADSTRSKGALQTQLAQVHEGAVDILVGTQMVAKGHDFRNMTLVAAIQPDGALFSSDFRAAERLFSLLMQAGGRAGRNARQATQSELWIQTQAPSHPLFQALIQHNYPRFANDQLRERQAAQMPPFASQALLRAEGRSQEAVLDFLQTARTLHATTHQTPGFAAVQIYPPVPMTMQRLANVERAQMLLESPSRTALHNVLQAWIAKLTSLRAPGILRWAVDRDPQQL